MRIQGIYTSELRCTQIFSKRKVVLFNFFDDCEKIQWAEASPLPGRSEEGIDSVVKALERLRKDEKVSLPASLQFAFDAPFLPPLSKPFSTARLLMGTPEQILQMAETVQREGATLVKMKASDLKISEVVELVRELKKYFRVRLDANSKWTLSDALAFARHFSPDDPSIDYIEDPLRDPSELRSFPLPFALDEGLSENSLAALLPLPRLRTLVLKPSVLGGQQACMRWISFCQKHNLKWVISSAFESGIGILQLAKLHAALPSCESPAGLDSYSYLQEDLLSEPLKMQGNTVIPPQHITVREELLCPI